MPRRSLLILAGVVAFAGWATSQTQQTLKLLHSVAPKYPQEARDKKIEGDVVLHIEINEEGAVHDPWVISGPKELRDAALAASSEVTLAFQLPKEK